MPAKSLRLPTRRSSRQSARRLNGGSSDAPPSHDPLQALHDEEVFLILEYLYPEDLVRASAVCRQWKARLEAFICTTAMRRSFPRAWDEHQHRLPLNRLELVREYRRQARGDYALRTGRATAGRMYSKAVHFNIRAPYVAWSDGKLRFNVENLFSAKAAWQGTRALYRSATTTRLIPTLAQTRIDDIGLAATLDLLFLRLVPRSAQATYSCKDLVYSIPEDRLVWSKERWLHGANHDDEERTSKFEVGRRAYLSDIAEHDSELEFVAEDLATGAQLYRRLFADVLLCYLHPLQAQDLIALHHHDRVTILAGDTGDIIRAVDLIGENFAIDVVPGSNNLVFSYHNNLPFPFHVQYHFYRLRRHREGGADEGSERKGGGGRYSLDELRRRHVCRVSNLAPMRGDFQRNLRECMWVEAEPSTVAGRQQWKIKWMREEAAITACACVPQLTGVLKDEPPGLAPVVVCDAGLPAPRERGSHYRMEHSVLVTLPPASRAALLGMKKAKAKAKAEARAAGADAEAGAAGAAGADADAELAATTMEGPRPRRPFESDADPQRALVWDSLDERYLVLSTRAGDLYILSFHAERGSARVR
ncbi:MAG: hypothetical protein M1826_004117 [Phylliscum demangeonii]|nr:MAG: hypothetical protein M1826_004117 [Phylliscum demangeonii]